MKVNNCIACTRIGKRSIGECQDALYASNLRAVPLHLCYPHSVELFKNGQMQFVAKYGLEDFNTHYELEDINEES